MEEKGFFLGHKQGRGWTSLSALRKDEHNCTAAQLHYCTITAESVWPQKSPAFGFRFS